MCKFLKIICGFSILTTSALAQNEIDHINTLYPSGYGKLAIDGDTLYVNVLNGHGVERYSIADPTNPVFVDREEVSGFDQIDFERKLMAKTVSAQLSLIDFADFDSTRVVSHISLMGMRNWKLTDNYFYIMLESDSLRTIGIADPVNPVFINTSYLAEVSGYPSLVLFGSSVVAIQRGTDHWDTLYVYRISEPDNIHLIHSEVLLQPTVGGVGICEARGDTMAIFAVGPAGYWWSINFVSYAQNDSSHFPSWGEYYNGHPRVLYSNDNSFLLDNAYGDSVIAYSFNNFYLLGIGPPLWDPNHGRFSNYEFDCTQNNNFIVASPESLDIYQSTHDSTSMPQIAGTGPAHFGILSSASYGNYILSGAESNGGELLIHHLNQSGNLDFVASVPNVPAKNIIIDSTYALCLCPTKISQVDISNPASPHVEHEISGLGTLVDFTQYDTSFYVIATNSFNKLSYDRNSGFMTIFSIPFQGAGLTSIVQDNYGNSYILKGSIGTILKIYSCCDDYWRIEGEYRMPHENYTNMEKYYSTLFISSPSGTDVINIFDLSDTVAFFGPEYFSDVHQLRISNDTLLVADGANGIRYFTFSGYPWNGLHYVGGYSTGNVINQVATIGDNFFVSDYYSLQHLHWGAPTGIEEPYSPRPPDRFALMQNYPNPFNAQTTISYYLPYDADIALEIYDLLGRRVETLARGHDEVGEHQVVWDAAEVPSGVYFYKLRAGEYTHTKRCLLIK